MHMIYPTDNEITNFLSFGNFDETIQSLINRTGIFNLVKMLRMSDKVMYNKYHTHPLVMFRDDVEGDEVITTAMIINIATIETLSIYKNYVPPYKFSKYGKFYINYLKSLPITRIQATIVEGNKSSCDWHEHLGFKEEGLMRKYDGKDNYYMYAYVKE